MYWSKLLCDTRQTNAKTINKHDMRSEFQKDYHRIICSASFRRLQDKTQVFPLDKSDFVRTRLTHSLEVSSFAKSLGQTSFQYLIDNKPEEKITPEIKENVCSILECAGLLHDIGNPPFGHFGEEAIRNWFRNNLSKIKFEDDTLDKYLNEQMKNDLYHFEGNAQALRLLTKLHYLVDKNGMHLTYALLNTLIKYPVSSCEINKNSGNIKDKKMGYYLAEKELFENITSSTGAAGYRYPLTYLLEAADDIAYHTADIEDAVKKGFLTYHRLLKELKSDKYINLCADDEELKSYMSCINNLEERYKRSLEKNIINPELNAVQNWVISVQGYLLFCATYGFTINYRDIMSGKFTQEILQTTYGATLIYALGDIAKELVFKSKEILKAETTAGNIITYLLDKLVPAVVNYEKGVKLSPMDERLMSLISDNYLEIYEIYSNGKTKDEKLYLRLLLVTDYICGMTDSYAKQLYRELNGID
ncbi:MAG: deoxyguanosinetriphosphate triphosphohydrolase [Ruminococcus sp.]|nr:deoxyguanosinetriphosphate triphosphohydrolase [Ruminococcus sp.]